MPALDKFSRAELNRVNAAQALAAHISEVIQSVEDYIDYPPHTIDARMAEKIVDALDRAGYQIIRKPKTT